MSFNGKLIHKSVNDAGLTVLTVVVSGYGDNIKVEDLTVGTDYRIDCSERRPQRTLEQNALMWRIIHEIAVSRCTERATTADEWNIYIEALERSGAKYEWIAALPQAEKMLKLKFRALQKKNSFKNHKGIIFNGYKAFYGSSEMDTAEMSRLLETIMDMAAEEGIPTETL